MSKRALLVGIDNYDKVSSLSGCINDAVAMKEVLERNEDGSKNYECRILTSSDPEPVTRKYLRQQWKELFENFTDDILFYFSGHGTPTDVGGYLVTQDGEIDDPGLSMNDLLTLANNSKAKSVLLILDCCFSGDLGNSANLQGGDNSVENQAQLREGVTILTASLATQVSKEIAGQGVFTKLVVGALSGGASDVRGRVSAASIYAYAEQALGAWDQRPMYKSHANCLAPIRLCKPFVSDNLLRELPTLFEDQEFKYYMNPSYEVSNTLDHPHFKPPETDKGNVAIFDKFKILRNARLVTTSNEKDLYFVALENTEDKEEEDLDFVILTPLGQFYWQLANDEKI
jgi:hypothetical protein